MALMVTALGGSSVTVSDFLHISTVPLRDYGLRKYERNRFVRIREKFGQISKKTRVSR